MSDTSTPEERTEMPTEKRMGEIRKEGAVHMSNEVPVVISMMTAFFTLTLIWEWMLRDIKYVLWKSFDMISNTEPLTISELYGGFIGLLVLVGPKLFIIVFAVTVATSLAVLLQTNWNVKEKKIDFKFSKLNPISGIQKIFSINGVVTTLKSVFKLALILPLAYFALKSYAPDMLSLMHTSITTLMDYTGNAMLMLFWKILYILIAFAIFDYFWTKYQWLRQNKMTKDEVKDEKKSIEGDEQTRKKIQAKGLTRIAQRIAQSVPQADVVITNPTHYAVALKYDRDSMSAPQVLAKGQGYLALRIREIAKESRVPIVERKPLARALYGTAEVGKSIPYELYKAVAEVIAYVYKLKNPYANQGAAPSQR